MSNSLRNIIIPKFYIYNTLLISFFLGGQCCIHLLKWYSPCFCFAVFRLSLMKRKTGYSAMCFTVREWVVLWSDQGSNSEMQNGESRNIHCKMNLSTGTGLRYTWNNWNRIQPTGNGAGKKRIWETQKSRTETGSKG